MIGRGSPSLSATFSLGPSPKDLLLGEGSNFRYVKGQFISIPFDMNESLWSYRLKVKAFKINAWFEERARVYEKLGYCFLPACITFRNWDEFLEFVDRGGRRKFVKEWKRISKKGEIIDYVVVMEFQKRGVPHFHYLLVVKGWLEVPEKVTTFRGLGIASLEKRIKTLDGAKKYLQGYIKKMTQISLDQYYELVRRLDNRKEKIRLYDFGRGGDSRRLFTALNKGWIRFLYSRFLKGKWNWRFEGGWLEYFGMKIKAVWDSVCFARKVFAEFKGFVAEWKVGGYVVGFEVESLDAIAGGWYQLRSILIQAYG